MSATGQQEADAKSHGRSRIGNGSALLPSVDGRSVWARLMRDTHAALLTHLGGADMVSETQRMTVRRIAALEAELVYLEDKIARCCADGGEPESSDLELYGRLANGQRRHLEVIGWKRVPRDVTPTLDQYLAQQTESPA